MLKGLVCTIAAAIALQFCTNAQEIIFKGKADPKFDGNKVIIYNRSTNDHDSVTIKDGEFELKVPFREPTRYFFYSDYEKKTKGGYMPYGILVTESGTVKMDCDIETFTNTKVKGARENDLYNGFADISNKAQQKILDDITEKYGKDFVYNRKPDTSDVKYKQLVKEYSDLVAANQKNEIERLTKFINDNAGSFSAVYLLDGNARMLDLELAENLYAQLTPKYKETTSGKSIAKGIEARKITAIGKVAPEFAQADTSGTMVKLSDFRGKYVLVDFWASWCGPCRAENPNLVNTYNKFKDKGFTVLGVSLDQPGKKEAWLNAIHKDNLTWTQVSDLKFWSNDAAVLYGVKAIPANFLLDKEGRIIAKDLRGEDLDKKLAEMLLK